MWNRIFDREICCGNSVVLLRFLEHIEEFKEFSFTSQNRVEFMFTMNCTEQRENFISLCCWSYFTAVASDTVDKSGI